MSVGRTYLSACIEGRLEVCLVALWTARVTSATVGGCCGLGGCSRRGLEVGGVDGGG